MANLYIQDQTYTKQDFSKQPLPVGEYENCIFKNCIFENVDLSNMIFTECEFKDCNISTAKIVQTAFREVKFKTCKLLGLHFDNCNTFLLAVGFEDSILNLSSFYKLNLKKTKFINCSLHEVDFTEADLSHSTFDNCDLGGATFDHSIIEKADFRLAFNYIIDPESNKIKKAKFSSSGIIGLLNKYNIEIEN